MEEFVELSRIIMGTLGHNIFEPVTESPSDKVPSVKNPPPDENDETLFYLTRKIKAADFTVKAVCKPNLKGNFVLLKGSIISPIVKDAVSEETKKRRNTAKISADNVLLEDVIFSTPSGAGEFVIGNTCNGRINWKTKDGLTLKDFGGRNQN